MQSAGALLSALRAFVGTSPSSRCPSLPSNLSVFKYATRLPISAALEPRAVIVGHQRLGFTRTPASCDLSNIRSLPLRSTICSEKTSSFRRIPRYSSPLSVVTVIALAQHPPLVPTPAAPRSAPHQESRIVAWAARQAAGLLWRIGPTGVPWPFT